MVRFVPTLFPVLFALLSCAEISVESPGATYDGPTNSCSNDGDCDTGVCDTVRRICVVSFRAEDAENLYVKVTPDPATGAPPQVFGVNLSDNGMVTTLLDIKIPVILNAATKAGEVDQSNLQATVIFTDVGNRLPGQPAKLTVYESDEAVFDLNLLPSTYGIMVLPRGAQADVFPVYYMDDITVQTSGLMLNSEGVQTDLVIPRATTNVEGIVRQGGLPVNGLEVVAVDRDTGRIVSTVDETVCQGQGALETCGKFRIGLAPGTETFHLKISRNFEPHHPVFTVGEFTAPGDEDTLYLTNDERLSLAPLGVPIRYLADVEKPVSSASGDVFNDPAPGCIVIFESYDVAGGLVEKGVNTNESGALEETDGVLGVNLYPGDYRVVVVPPIVPADSVTDYKGFTTPTDISISGGPEIGGQLFSLSFRPMITGRVVAEGKGVAGVPLAAEPVAGSLEFARSSAASSGADGEYQMWLDEATYRIHAEAPTESDYAWGVKSTNVDGDGVSKITLPIPFVASGTTAASSDQVDPIDLGGSIIEWYRVIDGRAYPIGRGAADANGEFTSLLPPVN